MTQQMRPQPSQLGDCLRALAALKPSDYWIGAAISEALGQKRRGSVTSLASELAKSPTAEAEDDQDAPAPSQAARRPQPVSSASDVPPARDAELDPISYEQDAPPPWLTEVPLLGSPQRVPDPFRSDRASLFGAKQQRAMVARLATILQASGELDLSAVVRHVAHGRVLNKVPRRLVATTLKGVRLLVDQGESMQPFQRDVAELVRTFRRTVGASRLRVEGFLGLPSRGISVGVEWHAYRPGNVGMGLVLISDLGLSPQALTGAAVDVGEWRRFFAEELRAGTAVTAVVPRDRSSLPAEWKRHARLVPWDRRPPSRKGASSGRGASNATGGPSNDFRGAGTESVRALTPLAALGAETLKLASACALAVRIEPALLRAMRLGVLPDSSVELEADLWFSPVVCDRASTGLVLDAQARELLLRRLRADKNLLIQSWGLISRAHAEAAPALRAEEEVCFHWLSGDVEAARAVLRSMVATVVDPGRRGAWRWGSQAVARLPRALLPLEEAQMLTMGVVLRSGERQLLHDLKTRGGTGWHWLRPPRREVELTVVLREGMIEFAPATTRSTLKLRVPDAAVVLIEILPTHGPGQTRLAQVDPTKRTLLPVEGDSFELQVIGGERYRLRAHRAALPKGQKFIARNRAPRVQIEYDVELYGAHKKVRLPFVMGVLTDLSGQPSARLPPLADRKFLEVDFDNFDARMKEIQPRVAFGVEAVLAGISHLSVDLTFESMSAFSPAAVARMVDPLRSLLEARRKLAELLHTGRGADELLANRLADPDLLDMVARSAELMGDAEGPERMKALAQQAGHGKQLEGSDSSAEIKAMIARLDENLSAQTNKILHHPDFQKLEGAWRGLYYLVNNTETDEELRIRVLNVDKAELRRSLRRFKGTAWDQSPLFKKVYEAEFGALGGQPFGCLVGDYHFEHSAADVELLGEIAKVAAAAHAPFIAGASPALAQMHSWQELPSPRDLTKMFSATEYAAWNALRASDDARYIGLAMPRFLARLPYGSKSNPIEEFSFEEELGDGDPARFTWANSAYGMAANITRSFKDCGWCTRIRGIESGGALSGLPSHIFAAESGGGDRRPTEVTMTDRRESELERAGLMPLVHRRNADIAIFFGAVSLHKAAEDDDPDTTANAALFARLPYVFACSRFVHYLKCIVRDKIGSFSGPEEMERHLQNWILQYVDGDPDHSSEAVKTLHPLAAAEVRVHGSNDHPGYYNAQIYLRPHYQLEGLTTSLRVVTRLPSRWPDAGRPPNEDAIS